MAALGEHLPSWRLHALPAGGLHVWVRLPGDVAVEALVARAAAAGVVVSPGTPYFPAEAPAPYLRLTYASAPPADLAEGVRRLAAVAC